MTVRRSLCAIALVAVSGVPVPGLADGVPSMATNGVIVDPVGECGGLAPYTQDCTFTGKLPERSTMHYRALPEFTGRIGVVMTTATGTYSGWCDFIGAFDPVCGSSVSGTLQIGQAFTANAKVSLVPPDGAEVPLAFGRWRVALTTQ